MKHIYLIRHAQSESNAQLTVRPNQKIRLTPLGHTQAVSLADWLMTNVPTPDKVFVSSYLRTHKTARPYLDRLIELDGKADFAPVELDDLREFNYLDYETIKDLAYPDIIRLADAFWATGDIHYTDTPTTDSYDSFVSRVANVRAYFDALPDGVYVAFGHGMWIGLLIWQLLHGNSNRLMDMTAFRLFEPTIRPKNCEVYLLQVTDTASTICKVRSRDGD